ncbi:magnesium transporter [Mycoplasmopsis californica]|uniref:Magnesium transporter MgtE n=1 Tax=Mycoplasmopsis californica TaxID=2113 RepID=A0A059XRS4_9BACT|nr:magnesium transporter [Mycoplasmopsis californica]AIA29518.1 magnesium transporter [Mycoplasmopsis californica]
MNESQDNQVKNLIKKTVISKDIKATRALIDEHPYADIASALGELSNDEQLTFLRMLKTDDAAEVFSYLETEQQTQLALSFTEEWGMKLLQELQSDELADVLEELPANVTSKIIAYTPQDKRNEINRILSYGEDEVGSIMSVDISYIQNTYTCEQALFKIRRDYSKNKAELVHYYYVVSPSQQLLGVLTLEEIVFAKPDAKIDDIYSPVTSISANEKQEQAAKIFSEHDMSVLPVTNNDNRLIGMITSDDVIDVINEAATEDLYKMAGISAKSSDPDDYLKTPWYTLLKSRILWAVLILLFSSIIEIASFFLFKQSGTEFLKISNSVSLLIAFVIFIPTITTGIRNAVAQTNITVKRALTMDLIEHKHIKKVLTKETFVGFMIGLILALINVVKLSLFLLSTGDLTQNVIKSWTIIISISLSLIVAMTLLQFLSALVPIMYFKRKKDPSNSSLVFLQSIAELITILIIFAIFIIATQIVAYI